MRKGEVRGGEGGETFRETVAPNFSNPLTDVKQTQAIYTISS